jgi:hypothetical protein
MQVTKFTLAFAAMAAAVLAQGDDCTGALSVSNGSFGPYTNAGSTTSFPWPCAAGGNDVWFAYVAPGTGPLTVDTCGATYDSSLEIFDGTAGCGGLVSLGCNDDSCGLQSSLTVNVNAGTTYYFRVGGFASGTGTFPLNVNGPAGTGTVATVTPYGTGCVRRFDSFYENFGSSAAFDLSGSGMTMIFTGMGYTALPAIGAYVPPTAAATALALGDDTEATVPLTVPFVYPGGVATALTVCSNGYISTNTGNGTAYTPNVGTFLSGVETSWRSWHDFNPAAAGSGQVKFEEIGGIAYVTWDGVYDFGGTSAANANTMQFQFDPSGNVTIVWVAMSGLGNAHLVGYSPGGASADPGSTDLSVVLPTTITVGQAIAPLALANTNRPVVNTSMSFDTGNIPAGTAFGAVLLGLTRFNPPLDLTGLGMPGCFQYCDSLSTSLFVPTGTTNSVPFNVPNFPGVTLQAQSVVFAPAAGLTPLGAISSNALELFLGTL